MANINDLKLQISEFDTNEPNRHARFLDWVSKLEAAMRLAKFTHNQDKIDTLFLCGGDELKEEYEDLGGDPVQDNYAAAIKTLTDEFKRETTEDPCGALTIRRIKQNPGEPFRDYFRRLKSEARRLIAVADNRDYEMQLQLLDGCNNSKIKYELIKKQRQDGEPLSTRDILKIASDIESLNEHELLSDKNKENKQINQLKKNERKIPSTTTICYKCGGPFPHRGQPCPALGAQCRKCGLLNHYARCCKSKASYNPNNNNQTRTRDQQQPRFDANRNNPNHGYGYDMRNSFQMRPNVNFVESNDNAHEYQNEAYDTMFGGNYGYYSNQQQQQQSKYTMFLVNSLKRTNMPSTKLKIFDSEVNFIIDTGSEVNILSGPSYMQLPLKPKLKLSDTKLTTFNNQSVQPVGYFATDISTNTARESIRFEVIDGPVPNLLSYESAVKLNLMGQIKSVNFTKDFNMKSIEYWSNEFPEVFMNKIGELKDVEVKLQIDETIRPIQSKIRHVPFHIRDKVELAIKELIENDIIEPAEGPTPWISPIVPVPKEDGSIRICTDAREANKAIKRERFVMPTADDLVVFFEWSQSNN